MTTLPIAVALSVMGSLGGLLLASVLLLLKRSVRQTIVPALISYAVGTLLGVSLLRLLPESLKLLESSLVLGTLLAGILSFFLLEKFVIWRHCHEDECDVHDSSATLILIGGAIHNFADGCIIGAAVLSSLGLGVTTAIAVAAHQVPQEVGDFAVLLGAGYSRRRALAWNAFTAMAGILGACMIYIAAESAPEMLPYIIAFAAGNFMYVAMADLIPGLHLRTVDVGALRQVSLVAAGVITVIAV